MTTTAPTTEPTTVAEPEAEPGREDQFLSVTAGLVFPKDALVPWAAYRVADETLREIEHAMTCGQNLLDELMREEYGPTWRDDPEAKSTKQMRLEAGAEAWQNFRLQHELRRDRKVLRNSLAESRFRPDVDPDTGRQYEFTAAGLGTMIHDLADRWILTGQRPDVPHPELKPYVDQLDRWLDVHQPRPILAEATGVNRTYGYAGRMDLVAELYWHGDDAWLPTIIDYTTSRTSWRWDGGQQVPTAPYPEKGLQCQAYGRFESVIRWDQSARIEKMTRGSGRWYFVEPDEWKIAQPMPATDRAAIVHITPEHCNAHPVYFSDWLFKRWLYSLEQARTLYSPTWKKIVGPVMAPPHRPSMRMPGETPLMSALRESVELVNGSEP